MAVVLIASLIGSVTGEWAIFMLVGVLGLLLWYLQQIYILETFVNGNNREAQDELHGIWRYVAEYSERSRRQSRKRKKRLARIVQRFHQTLEAMPDAAIVLDENQRIEWSNTAARRLLDVSHRNEKAGGKICKLITAQSFVSYMEKGDFSAHLEMPSPVTSSIDLQITATPFGQGQVLLMAHDITESKQLQSVRRDFIANVSHELRTPLTVVSGYMEMLQQEELDPHVLDALESSSRQADRMQSIVRDLLMLSRLEMEGDEPAQEGVPVSVPSILHNLVADAERLSGDKMHRFNLHADQRLGLLGSESELTSALGNLIFNTVIHTPPGTGVDIFWGLEGATAKYVVADKGPGIDEKHLRRLTERFYRVDKGRSRESGGTGLGLSIVKHVVKRHEGLVEIESTPGEGTRFILSFPIIRTTRIG